MNKSMSDGHGNSESGNNGYNGKQQWRLTEAQQITPATFWDVI
jgi:hypothetical protein